MKSRNITKEVGKGYEQFREGKKKSGALQTQGENLKIFHIQKMQIETKLSITIYY